MQWTTAPAGRLSLLPAAGPLVHPHPWRARPAGRPACMEPWTMASTQQTVSGSTVPSVGGGISCMCLVIFNTADRDHPPPPKVLRPEWTSSAWDGPHTHACMHALASLLSHPHPSLLLSLSHRHIAEEPLPWPAPCHACCLGISLSLSRSELGVGAHKHAHWSSPMQASRNALLATSLFQTDIHIHGWKNNGIKRPQVPS
jgi:hypothetical protein